MKYKKRTKLCDGDNYKLTIFSPRSEKRPNDDDDNTSETMTMTKNTCEEEGLEMKRDKTEQK